MRGYCRLLTTAECVPRIDVRDSAVARSPATARNYGGPEKLMGLLPSPSTLLSLDPGKPAQHWVSRGIHQRITSSGTYAAFGLITEMPMRAPGKLSQYVSRASKIERGNK